MEQDSLKYDSTGARPLPSWLIRQKEGLNTYTPEKIEMKDDKTLQVSFVVTGAFILLLIGILTIIVLKKFKSR